MTDRPHYRVTLYALPDDVPPDIRLRGLLKTAFRAYRFRVTELEPLDWPPPADSRSLVEPQEGPSRSGP
jgi:hypothetical protein